MTQLRLKDYQSTCISRLADYFADVRRLALAGRDDAEARAFEAATGGRMYRTASSFDGVPYVCIRVPTGGGKTLIASHAVGTIARELGHTDSPVCLWVVPTTTIRDQTLAGLGDRSHPYRAALAEHFGASIQVMTLEEALTASRAMVSTDAVVIVTTIQSYRIDQEETRRVYQDNGYLMDHFDGLPEAVRARFRGDADVSPQSLANALRIRAPIVIIDEAHNARTETSFKSLARFGPAAVLELTATPQLEHDPARGSYASNVLHAVAALQLQQEGMIKLPVELESRKDWLQVLEATVARRGALESVADAYQQGGGRYVRPIALVQAQPRSKSRETHTVEAVKRILVERVGLPAETVRIVAYDTDEIGGEDLLSPDCSVRYVVTVDKLREGWDCPFAYVLGSIGKVATPTAVEQLLGRILRMPYAEPTGVPELDRAYAVVQSENVVQTAKGLRDSLVERCGFDDRSAEDALRVTTREEERSLFAPRSILLSAHPDMDRLPEGVREVASYDASRRLLELASPLTAEIARAIQAVVGSDQDRVAVEAHWSSQRLPGTPHRPLSHVVPPVRVPQLAISRNGRLSLFEPSELDEFDWHLDTCDPAFTEADFDVALTVGERALIRLDDAGGARITSGLPVKVTQMSLISDGDGWAEADLVRWLNAELHRGGRFQGLSASFALAWILRAVRFLTGERQADLKILVRKRHALADAMIARVGEHGRRQVREAYGLLIAGQGVAQLKTTFELPAVISEERYAPHQTYTGPIDFPKHAFDRIGAMGKKEEPECAQRIDAHANVKRWVRNLESPLTGAFGLPLSPGTFYPDFVAELEDGRVAAIEYKGAQFTDNRHELHKKAVGEAWAQQSGGRAVFVWVADKDWSALSALDSVEEGASQGRD